MRKILIISVAVLITVICSIFMFMYGMFDSETPKNVLASDSHYIIGKQQKWVSIIRVTYYLTRKTTEKVDRSPAYCAFNRDLKFD